MIKVKIDTVTKTIQPLNAEGDAFYGLAVGTNGTATICRRACVEPQGVVRFVWVRFNGHPAIGVTLVPSGRDTNKNYRSQWEG